MKTETENGVARFDRRGTERRRTLTPSEIVQQERIREAMRKYDLAEREWERETRMYLWKAMAWGLVLTAILALAIVWVVTRHG